MPDLYKLIYKQTLYIPSIFSINTFIANSNNDVTAAKKKNTRKNISL